MGQHGIDRSIVPLDISSVRDALPVEFLSNGVYGLLLGDEHPIDFLHPVHLMKRTGNEDDPVGCDALSLPRNQFLFRNSLR